MAKKKIICDTDVIIDYWNSKNKRHLDTKRIIDQKIGLNYIVISAITIMELLTGTDNKAEESKIKEKMYRFNIALINDDITQVSLNLFEDYRLSHNLTIPDCLIAATAIVTDLEFFTYNVKDFKFIKSIRLFKA